jgi:hypothetical protein
MVFQLGYLVSVSAKHGAKDYTFTLVRQHAGAHFHALAMTPMQGSIFLPPTGI